MNSTNKKPTGSQPPLNRAQPGARPVAPPVYRPQPVPKVLQRKVSPVQNPNAAQAPRLPVAPPVYRPQATQGVQAKLAGPTQTKPQPVAAPVRHPRVVPKVLQMKKTTSQPAPHKQPPGPLIGRRSSVVQRKYGRDTYVEVNGPGGTWYGVVTGTVHHASGTLRIRVGGTDEQVEVPEAQVRLHPTIGNSPGAAFAAASRMVAASYEERRDGDSVATAGGTWTAVEYNSKMGRDDPSARGLHIKLVFTPNHTVNATNIVLVQTVAATKNTVAYFLDASVKARSANNVSIDQRGSSASPEYAVDPARSGGGFGSAPLQAGAGEHGYRYQLHPGHWTTKPAWLTDNPHMRGIVSASRQVFETTAIAAAGHDQGRYYGSVRWGWTWSPNGMVKLIPLAVVTAGYGASAEFTASARQWNRTLTSEGAHPVQIPV